MNRFIIFCCLLVSFAVSAQQRRPITPGISPITVTNFTIISGPQQTIAGPSVIAQFVASLTSPNSETNGVVIEWSFDDSPGNVLFSDSTGLTNVGQFNAVGRYRIKTTAVSGSYQNENSFYVFVTDQNITNFIPTVQLITPPNGAVYTAPIDLLIAADATDKDGTIAQVVFYNGPTILGTSTAAPFTFTIPNAGATTYVFAAAVTDNRGATNLSISRTVTVNPAPTPPANVLPTVNITAPGDGLTFTNPVILSFSATATDADGVINSVIFADNGVVIFTDTDLPFVSQISPGVGVHQLTATATDNSGSMAIATNTITVVDPTTPNIAPVVNIALPTNGQVFTAPVSFVMAATATDSDGITSVQFLKDGSLLGTDASSPYTASVGPLAVGTYILTARATDSVGAIGSTNITIMVNPAPGTPPVVALTSPADGAVFLAGATINLTATASDADGTVTNVSWWSVTPDSPPDPETTNQSIRTLIISDTTSPYSQNWTPSANSYGLVAVAKDNSGLASTTAVNTITVRLPIPPSVTLTSPTNGQVFNAGSSIPLAAAVSDPDSLTTSVAFWQFQPDVLISTDASAPYSGSWAGVPAGNYSIVAKATYSGTKVVSSSAVSIQIVAAPPVTVYVDAGPSKTAQLSVYQPYFDTEKTANQAQFNSYASSALGTYKYDLQYVLLGYRDMYIATRRTNYIDQALIWCEMAVAAAAVTDSNGNKNWTGPWTPNPYSATSLSYELYDEQGGAGLSSIFRCILTDPDLKPIFGARATVIYNFIRDHIVDKILVKRKGLPWFQNFLHDATSTTTDKAELVLGMLLDLKLSSTALGNTDNATKGYPALVTEFAQGMKDWNGHSPGCFTTFCYAGDPAKCGLVWQKGHVWQSYLIFDTSHCERIPEMVLDCFEAGQTIDFSIVQGLANTFTKIIWDGSTTSPQFRNFHDGSNGTFLNRPPYNDGKIYAGWSMLSRYDDQALIVSQAMLRAIKNGASNPSILYNSTFLGRTALSGHIARAVSQRQNPPYAQLDGIVTGSPITSTTWTHTGPGTVTIVKPTSPVTTVLFGANAVGQHSFTLSVVSGTNTVSDVTTVALAAMPQF